MIIKFEVSGERYVRINMQNQSIDIYSLNHSFIKSISYASYPHNPNNIPVILYLSEKLFDPDNKIEFMWIYVTSPDQTPYTRIYNEDGTLLFQADSMAARVVGNIPQQQYPIYNTANGTKMILSCYANGQAKVFSLPGTLTECIAKENENLLNATGTISNPYPNPSINYTQIDYKLPDEVNNGEIVFYDLQGIEHMRFKIDRTFNTLLVSTLDIAAGTYYYQLQTTKQNSEAKKMVVIK
ncbi:MAG: T9SS type A sorting domain-containing protein [Bacteroidota bacterium]